MPEKDSSSGAARRRPKRVSSPSQKYEVWLQLVRQETTIAEAAAAQQVDRSTIVRIKEVAKQGALSALAGSKPGLNPANATTSSRPRRRRSPGSRRPARSSR